MYISLAIGTYHLPYLLCSSYHNMELCVFFPIFPEFVSFCERFCCACCVCIVC